MIEEKTFRKAHDARATLMDRLQEEQTDCLRLFHGASEGFPGVSVDRYGPLLFVQVSDRLTVSEYDIHELAEKAMNILGTGRVGVVARRAGPSLELLWESTPGAWSATYWVYEFGLRFAIQPERAHRDLQLFLDARSLKRTLIHRASGGLGATESSSSSSCGILNLFSFTCSIGCHLAAHSTAPVWNVDFSSGNLKWGEKNARKNRLKGDRIRFLEADCLGFMKALLRSQGRRRKGGALPEEVLESRFPLIVLDPPTFSKGRFGVVDMLREPESVVEPAWELLAGGGLLAVTNNSSKVSQVEFRDRLTDCLDRFGPGADCVGMEWVSPDPDFPTFDGNHPLKVVLCRKSG